MKKNKEESLDITERGYAKKDIEKLLPTKSDIIKGVSLIGDNIEISNKIRKVPKQTAENGMRSPLGRFLPGVVGNPLGRPKQSDCFREIAREMLASNQIDISYTFPKDGKNVTRSMHMQSDKSILHSIAVGLIKKAMDGDVYATTTLLDRTYGRPKYEIESNNQGNLTLEVIRKVITPEDNLKPIIIEESEQDSIQLEHNQNQDSIQSEPDEA